MIHELLYIFIVLCIVGLILWGINQIPGIPPIIKVVIYVIIGVLLLLFGILVGVSAWTNSFIHHTNTPAGTVMLASLPIILGLQLFLAFLSADIASTPREPLIRRMK